MFGQHHILHFLKNRELDELYACISLRTFSISMITVFVPIFLISLSYSIQQVLVFYIILHLSQSVSSVFCAKIVSRIGFHHSILYSLLLTLIVYIMLWSLDTVKWPLEITAIIFGVSAGLFWVGYHSDFAKFSKQGERGKSVGATKIFSFVFHAMGPIAGGIIITLLGFHSLYLATSIILVASAFPLFFSKEVHSPADFSIKKIFSEQKPKHFLGYFAAGFDQSAAAVIWPIIIFYSILNDFTLLGTTASLSIVGSIIVAAIAGILADKNRWLLLKASGIIHAAIWAGKSFVSTTSQVFAIDIVYGMNKSALSIPIDAKSYDVANRKNIIQHIAFRESSWHFGSAVLLTAVLLSGQLNSGIWLASLASLLFLVF